MAMMVMPLFTPAAVAKQSTIVQVDGRNDLSTPLLVLTKKRQIIRMRGTTGSLNTDYAGRLPGGMSPVYFDGTLGWSIATDRSKSSSRRIVPSDNSDDGDGGKTLPGGHPTSRGAKRGILRSLTSALIKSSDDVKFSPHVVNLSKITDKHARDRTRTTTRTRPPRSRTCGSRTAC